MVMDGGRVKRSKGRAILCARLMTLAIAALGVGLWLGLGAHQSAQMAQASGKSGVPSLTRGPAPPADFAVGSHAESASRVQPLPPDAAGRLPASLPSGSKGVRVPILMYHYVDAFSKLPHGPWGKRLTLSALKFRQEMAYLAVNGYHAVTLSQICEALAGSALLPPKPVALTFDDGGEDNYTTALPVLRRYHFAATFFVITADVGKPGYMSWAELRAMSHSGMAIESHTVHHLDLTLLGSAKLKAELVQSRTAIHSGLDLRADYLAYPGGNCDQQVMAAAQTAGYRAAFTDKSGAVGDLLYPHAQYDWPREGIGPSETLALFAKTLAGAMGRQELKISSVKPGRASRSGSSHA
jgi:peptidoglycan/xylan/chitin deacetylase (PgdA/CDA1 family)